MTESRTPDPRLQIRGLKSALAGPFDLSVSAAECVAITGSSGSGKSLFLRMIADLDPNEGEVWLNGQERTGFSEPAWRRRVVYSAAEPGWWSERIAEHFPPHSASFARELMHCLRLGLDLMQAPVAHLSTGERQRLALIRALALDSPVLLLDEPTGALDEQATALVEAVLCERLDRGTTMLLVTHDPEQARRLGTRLYRMAQRRLFDA